MNLLVALDALLAEGSVTGAAKRLGLSSSAMSRTLTRLRAATGDPLLVRAGRGLVPTPHARELRDTVRRLTHEARTVLSPPAAALDIAALEQTFTLRAGEGFLARFLPPLVRAIREAAPGVRLCFAPKPSKDARPLREGPVDLDIGVAGDSGPELRSRFLFRDKVIGAVRPGHPLLTGPITPQRYASCDHVVASRRGARSGPVDEALRVLGLTRNIAAIVPGFPDAMRLARSSDLVALVPSSCLIRTADEPERPDDLIGFALPLNTPDVVVSLMWHPRLDADPAHRWLRDTVQAACLNHMRHAGTRMHVA
ncbi:LysR family transcriptional regulator [Novosphingobium terrae]|uniref:LysR family transcriptional regulator n=1 Tax=Novosphingobium terrae TaxID=2726189 RepID=UPI001F130AB3|nr:LysR family transcriptional regulator [Novosphingobium terrae]